MTEDTLQEIIDRMNKEIEELRDKKEVDLENVLDSLVDILSECYPHIVIMASDEGGTAYWSWEGNDYAAMGLAMQFLEEMSK